MNLKKFLSIPALLFWPTSLYLANTRETFLGYFIPSIIILVAFFIYRKFNHISLILVLSITLIEPKLALFPIFFTLISFLINKNKHNLVYLFLSLVVFTFSFKPFIGQTIFGVDYEARQQVIRNSQLYPSILLARTFHNKARIVLNKFTYNTFALIDPNNYFFGYHPRQLVGGQNLAKFPFIMLIPFLYGLYYLPKYKNKEFVLITLFAGIISLSALNIFDGNDFILWIPIFLILSNGINQITKNRRLSLAYSLLFFLMLIPEVIRIFIK